MCSRVEVYGPHIAQLYASSRAQSQMRSLGHFFKKGATLEEKSKSASFFIQKFSKNTCILPGITSPFNSHSLSRYTGKVEYGKEVGEENGNEDEIVQGKKRGGRGMKYSTGYFTHDIA